MDLILTVVEDPQGANMRNHTKVFDQQGGTFGRAEDNTWVLPDPERVVSSRHAAIVCEGGQFFVVDSSTNGTFLNNSGDAILKGKKTPLNEGDIVNVGEYKLKVSVRRPETKSSPLPKGLGAVDFLDEGDKTRMGDTNYNKSSSGITDFDAFLEPGAPRQQEDQWGFLADQPNLESEIKPQQENDPLLGGGFANAGDVTGSNLDPLASLGSGNEDSGAAGWDDDDDWWKSGSESDHAAPDQQFMQVQPQASQQVSPQIPTPPSPKQTPQEQIPVQQTPVPPQAPPPPVTPQPPAEDNPFAASVALVKGQELPPGFIGQPNEAHTPPPAQTPGQQPIPNQPQVPDPLGQPVQDQGNGNLPPLGGHIPTSATPPPSQPMAQQSIAPPQSHQSNLQQTPPVTGAQPQQAPQQSVPVSSDAQALAQLLGLSHLPPTQLQQLVPEASAIVEETINRLIDLMRARTSVKNELRVQRTMIEVQDNNPLKFSASATDAMAAMFSGTNSAYMAPQDAVKNSFDDLSDHQVAVLSGMRAAYEFMLKQFSPAILERRLNTGGGLTLSKSAKKWEAFERYFSELQRDPENSYRRLFGEEFANAYEQQLSELKNTRAINKQSR